jgi:hypothetical protein
MKTASKLFFLLLMTTSLPIWAEASGPDYWQVQGVADNDVLNIRIDADPHAKKIGEIPPGASCIQNLGCQGGLSFEEFMTLSKKEKVAAEKARPRWCQIEYQGIRGWVAGRYLAEGSCNETASDQ